MKDLHNMKWYQEYAKAFGRSLLQEYGLTIDEAGIKSISEAMYRATLDAKIRSESGG